MARRALQRASDLWDSNEQTNQPNPKRPPWLIREWPLESIPAPCRVNKREFITFYHPPSPPGFALGQVENILQQDGSVEVKWFLCDDGDDGQEDEEAATIGAPVRFCTTASEGRLLVARDDILTNSFKYPTSGSELPMDITIISQLRATCRYHAHASSSSSSINPRFPPCTPLVETPDDLKMISQQLQTRIMGQQDAVNKIAQKLIAPRRHRWFSTTNKPEVLCFGGPTGTGKTEMAKAIVHGLFEDVGDPQAMRRVFTIFNMNEYTTEESVKRFSGADPGYVGYEAGGNIIPFLLEAEATRQEREKKGEPSHTSAVILFDEIDKAHPTMLTYLMNFFDAGQLSSTKHEHVDGRATVIILTTNAGCEELSRCDHISVSSGYQKQQILQRALLRTVFEGKEELLRRIGTYIPFSILDEVSARQLIEHQLNKAVEIITKRGLLVRFSDNVKNVIYTLFEYNSDGRSTEHLTQTIVKRVLVQASMDAPKAYHSIAVDLIVTFSESTFVVDFLNNAGLAVVHKTYKNVISLSEISVAEQASCLYDHVVSIICQTDATCSLDELQNILPPPFTNRATGLVKINRELKNNMMMLEAIKSASLDVIALILHLPFQPDDFCIPDAESGCSVVHLCCRLPNEVPRDVAVDILSLILKMFGKACGNASTERIRDLLNQPDKNGNTALHYAIDGKNARLAKLLLERGADMFIKNQNHESALRGLLVKPYPSDVLLVVVDHSDGKQLFVRERQFLSRYIWNVDHVDPQHRDNVRMLLHEWVKCHAKYPAQVPPLSHVIMQVCFYKGCIGCMKMLLFEFKCAYRQDPKYKMFCDPEIVVYSTFSKAVFAAHACIDNQSAHIHFHSLLKELWDILPIRSFMLEIPCIKCLVVVSSLNKDQAVRRRCRYVSDEDDADATEDETEIDGDADQDEDETEVDAVNEEVEDCEEQYRDEGEDQVDRMVDEPSDPAVSIQQLDLDSMEALKSSTNENEQDQDQESAMQVDTPAPAPAPAPAPITIIDLTGDDDDYDIVQATNRTSQRPRRGRKRKRLFSRPRKSVRS